MAKKEKPVREPVKIEGEVRKWTVEYGVYALYRDTVRARTAEEAMAIVLETPQYDDYDYKEIDDDVYPEVMCEDRNHDFKFNYDLFKQIQQDIKNGLHPGTEPR